MPVQIEHGLDLFESGCDTLVNPVNSHGRMGAGLARAFAERYPDLVPAYQAACETGELGEGGLWWWVNPGQGPDVLCAATKSGWWTKSTISAVRSILDAFLLLDGQLGLRRVAWPLLGCGLGRLDPNVVLPEMVRTLAHAKSENLVCVPQDTLLRPGWRMLVRTVPTREEAW